MKKTLLNLFLLAGIFLSLPSFAYAASNPEVANFTHDSIVALISLASIAVVFFLVRGAYMYITSTGDPTALEEGKKTIKQALIGLVIVIGASVFASLLDSAMTQPASTATGTAISLAPIQPVSSGGTLTQIILDAVIGFLQNIIQSATKPIFDGITWFLTSTPPLVSNSVVFNFWLVIVGITDSLFALVIALLGFHVMSSSTFGFEELTLKELLPKIALAFVGANTSIFLLDWIISLCGTMVHALINATGGLDRAWILNAFDPSSLLSGTTVLISLIFIIIFLILAVVLLLFYIGRLMLLALGAVMSPLICLLWAIPKMADIAESAFRGYLVTIFSVFIHVIIIQLASAFLTVPGQSGENPIIGVLIGIAMFLILLKSTALGVQLAITSQTFGTIKSISGQVMNVIGAAASSGSTAAGSRAGGQAQAARSGNIERRHYAHNSRARTNHNS
ncbi:MAG TPA: hypothetical protein PK263_05340 [bacterium]|nr:hypothetical protein [bacterium]